MTKRLLSMLLAVVMLCILLPTVVFADPVSSITTWAALQEAITNAGTTETTIQLTQSLTATGTDEALTINEGQKITIDLNGYVLDRGLIASNGTVTYTNYGNVFDVKSGSNLTINDSNTDKKAYKFSVLDNGLWKYQGEWKFTDREIALSKRLSAG